MSELFQFSLRNYAHLIPVINERVAWAGSGIFFIAIVAFMNAWLTGPIQPVVATPVSASDL